MKLRSIYNRWVFLIKRCIEVCFTKVAVLNDWYIDIEAFSVTDGHTVKAVLNKRIGTNTFTVVYVPPFIKFSTRKPGVFPYYVLCDCSGDVLAIAHSKGVIIRRLDIIEKEYNKLATRSS